MYGAWLAMPRAPGRGQAACLHPQGAPPPPYVVSVDTLTDCGLCPPPLALGGSGFTSKGGHVIPPPGPTGPTTPHWEAKQGNKHEKNCPRDI